MNRALPLIVAFAGFFAGVLLFGMVGRWLYAVIAAIHEHRSAVQNGVPRQRLASVLFPVAVLHSGLWALIIALVLSYYVLSQPHSPSLLWFFSGTGVGLLFMLVIVIRAMRRVKATPVPSAEHTARSRAALAAKATPEGYRLRIWAAVLGSIPGIVLLSAMWWDSIVRAPELLIIIAILCFLFAYVLGWYFRQFLFPKPWRLPPRK